MSLIEEALRRLKDPGIPGEPAPQDESRRQEPAAHSWPTSRPRPHAPNALLGATAAILVLTAVFIAASTFWTVRTLHSPPSPTPPAPISAVAELTPPAPAAAAAPEPAPEPSAPVKEPLTLTGIVEGEGKSYAVINGAVVGVGDQINGATLLNISSHIVRVREADGTETDLILPK